jgi:flavin reductase (DIM6/NTAB) family NADH-FMN oxidoreductase RutF
MITEDMKMAMKGIVPSAIVTSNSEGVPNISYISQIYYVDENHVAVSHQFFNKTIRNIKENPFACVNLLSPDDFYMWNVDLEYSHSETEGDLFDEMEMQLEAIASMQGMEDVFKLKAAEVFTVLAVKKIY